MPAFAIETSCYSIAWCRATRSTCVILSSSSTKQIPPEAKTSAPAYKLNVPAASRRTATVRPAAEAPRPVAKTDFGAALPAALRSYDLATPGSPSRSRWMSPRVRGPPGPARRETPPINAHKSARLAASERPREGAIDLSNKSSKA